MSGLIVYLVEFAPLIIGLGLSIVILQRMKLYCSSNTFYFQHKEEGTEEKESTGLVEIGGVAMFPIVLIALCITLGTSRLLTYYGLCTIDLGITGDRVLQILSGCAILYIVGLKNDLHGVFPHTKFIALLVASAMFPLTGLWIHDFQGILGIHQVSPWIGIPFTIFFTMYITEAIALLDDIDGLGIGLMSVMLLIFLGFSIAYGFTLGILITAASLGICIPYSLIKICRPSWKKTLVGNAGSYPLGYILAYATLSLVQPAGIEMPNGTLMIVMGTTMVPMIDLLRTLRLRVQEGRSLIVPDRNLMQHRFIRMGIRPAWAPICIIAMIVLFAATNTIWALMGYSMTILLAIDVVLWIGMHISINALVRRYEERQEKSSWQVSYGREAWEADKPVEKIQHKHELFGTLGLLPQYIMGEETDFIPDGMSKWGKRIKRVIDFIIACLLIVLCGPIFLLCYLLIKIEDGGSVIYCQERIGRFGKPFKIYKFRSMKEDAEEEGQPMLSHAYGADDKRITRVGRFLRSHHLDELPQLWNILRGDMSFVGYRPERAYYIKQIMEHDPRYAMLYQIRPGVTSYATLYNGYTDTMEKMLRRLNYDLYYLEHRSFWFDVRVLWLTFISILFGKKF